MSYRRGLQLTSSSALAVSTCEREIERKGGGREMEGGKEEEERERVNE